MCVPLPIRADPLKARSEKALPERERWLGGPGISLARTIVTFLTENLERVLFLDAHGTVALQAVTDVSRNGEFGWLYRWMLAHDALPTAGDRLVVDVGAYDGILGSMSYNFLQAGWAAVLVEPNPTAAARVRAAMYRFWHRGLRADVVEAALSPETDAPDTGTGLLYRFEQTQTENTVLLHSQGNFNVRETFSSTFKRMARVHWKRWRSG